MSDIIYLHQYFATPESNCGTRSYEIAKRLIKKGHKVKFITTSAYFPTSYKLKPGWNLVYLDGVELHVLKLNYSNNDSFFSRIIKFIKFCVCSTLKVLTLKADVVYATSTPLTIAIPSLVYSKFKKVPLVFEVRDLWPELPIAMGVINNKLIISFASWLERYTYRNSKRLIGLSPGMCDGIIKHGIAPEHVTLASNSCDTDLFDVDCCIGEEYLKSKLSFVKGRKLIVYTGTFGLINNVSYIVELAKAAKVSQQHLCFIAIGDGMEKEMIIAKAKKSGVLNHNLYILPSVPKTEIVELLSASDMSLSLFGPIKEMWHNSANKLFDSLASQTPIAINYGGWQKAFIDEYQCGLVLDPDDYYDAISSISSFLGSDERYQSAVRSCKKLSYENFSRDEMANRVESTLMEAIND